MPSAVLAFDLLCALARPRPDLSEIRDILSKGVDTDVLFSLADRHAVRPSLARLPDLVSDPALSAELRRRFREFERPHVLRTLSMVDELIRIGDAFAAGGLRFVTFKGPILAQQLYGGVSQREYADIDLLVPPEEAAMARAELGRLGYRNAQGDADFVETFLARQRQVALERPGFEPAIDLHWAFSGHSLPFPVAAGEVWSQLGQASLGGRAIPTLSAEDLALLLAGHGTKEAWHNLVWVADFARLVEHYRDLDWTRILHRARRQRAGDAVLLAATIANRLLGSAIPPPLADALAGRRHVISLADRLIADLRRGGTAAAPRPNLSDLLLCDRAVDRAWARIRIASTPSPGDFKALPLPPLLWPLYWVIRPFRLAAKAVRGR